MEKLEEIKVGDPVIAAFYKAVHDKMVSYRKVLLPYKAAKEKAHQAVPDTPTSNELEGKLEETWDKVNEALNDLTAAAADFAEGVDLSAQDIREALFFMAEHIVPCEGFDTEDQEDIADLLMEELLGRAKNYRNELEAALST